MKLNKRIASGALALALVTPVVANAAEDTTYVTTTLPKAVTEKVVVDGKTYTKAQFQKALEEANKNYNKYLAAKAEADKLEESLKVAKDRYKKAYEAYEEEKLTVDGKEVVKEKRTNLDIAVDNLNNMIASAVKADEVIAYLDKGYGPVTEGSNINGSKLAKDSNAKVQTGEFEEAIDRVNKAYAELKEAEKDADKPATDSEKYREYTAASYEKDRLQDAYDAAKAKADDAKKDSDKSFGALNAIAEAYNVIVEATNNGIEVKDDDKTPSKDKITDEQLAKLQETVKNARETLKAVEILKQFMPNTSTANIEKLDKIAAEQRVALEKAEKILKANNITASLFSTAYAAEEEATSEDVDALIDELETNDKEMKDLMKEIDKDAKKDDEKPADDDKKDDDKKDDDKKDDEKPADDDKKDDKKPAENKDNKKDTTKVVDRTANKKAGSNAKTGIAGVAGVAGVLAAASVAYAASKKNN